MMTTEDRMIASSLSLTACDALIRELVDQIDYRTMIAREVASEHAWRIEGRKATPREFAEHDAFAHALDARTVREQVEHDCGEPLAGDA
jgi:predicted glycosyl hydrolase (DUF1957 family)